MLKKDNGNLIPKVKFTFIDEEKSENETKKEIAELLKKRDEILASMRSSVPNNAETNQIDIDYPRKSR